MALWAVQRREGGQVAIRMAHAHDMPRRVVFDDADPSVWREEWRCHGCATWFERGAVTLVPSGREVGGAPEMHPYCAPCLRAAGVRSADSTPPRHGRARRAQLGNAILPAATSATSGLSIRKPDRGA
jgi:hypothetical protein